MVSSVLLAFGYVWGTMFRNPQMIAYVKAELLEILITGALLVVIFAGVGAISGLTVGDILVGFESHPINDHDELFAYLAGDVVGKTSTFEILRGGQPQPVKINVEERPSAPEEERHHHGHGRWHGHR